MSKNKSHSSAKTETPTSSERLLKHGKKEDTKGKTRVFVYGTLKQGHHNNGILTRGGAEFVGYDTITGALAMVDLGAFPGVISDINIPGATSVHGEVYVLPDVKGKDNPTLEALDWLEGNGSFYTRTKFRTDILDTLVWMYTLPLRYLDNQGLPEGIWRPEAAEETAWEQYYAERGLAKSG